MSPRAPKSGAKAASVPGAWQGLLRMLGLAQGQYTPLVFGMVCLVGVDVLQLFVPRVIKFAVDDLTRAAATPASLLWQAGLITCLALSMFLLRLLWRPIIMRFSRRVERDLRERLYERLLRLDVSFLHDVPPGEIMIRSSNDLNNIRMACGIGLVAAMDGILMALAAMGFMIYISPLLTALALIPMPVIAWATKTLSVRMYRDFQESQVILSDMTGLARESLAGIRVLSAYDLMDDQMRRMDRVGRRFIAVNIRLAKLSGFIFPLAVLVTNLSLAVILGAGGPMAVLGRITPGDFVAFTAYLMMFTWPMMALGWVVSLMQRAGASLDRVQEVITAQPKITDHPNPVSPVLEDGLSIDIKGLTFNYPGEAAPALSEVSLSIPAGGKVALVGRIGSGKSTVLALLGRLYDPPAESIFINGVDLRRLPQKELRSLIVQVPQRAFLFSTSVRENLCLGRKEAAEEDLWRVLALAGVEQEVAALPQGLDSKLGERGHTLSGGQRQRLALARALLADPPLLVLDDPLSAVDTNTESEILENLAALRSGRTTLMVSHRLASVAFADHIYVIDAGRIAQEGSHAELLRQKGIYRTLFAEQTLLSGSGEA